MFKGKCWWITGASSGIGKGLARELSAQGASLILSGRNVAALDTVARECADVLVLPFEATDFDLIAGIVDRAWSWKGRIDGLVNNAGITQRSLAVDTAFSVYQKIIAVDLLAPIALTQALLPKMVAAGGARIVATSSVAGIAGSPMRSAYSAAKHGLIGYHDAIRVENEHLGIKVHVVAPGSVQTNVSRNSLLGDGSVRGVSDSIVDNGISPADAARAIVQAVSEGKRELLLATGVEHDIAVLRRSDPEKLFDFMSDLVKGGYVRMMEADTGQS